MRDLNFFSPYIVEKKATINKNFLVIGISSVVIILTLGSFLFNYFTILKLNSDIGKMKKYLTSKETIENVKKAEEYNKKIDVSQKYYSTVDAISSEINKKELVNSELLKNINSALPQSVNFQSLTIDKSGVQIQGTSGDRVAVAEFQYNLKNTGKFENVNVISINSNQGNSAKYVFTMKCLLKDVGSNEANQ